jgi:hypothetical protein
MVYNALATMWYGGYDPKPQFYILLGKLNTMQRQRHHTPEPFLCHSAKADFYPFVLRIPGLKEMAQNESVNQIANYVERKKLPL